MDILIIGAGPIGCYAASLLAEKHSVTVIEEHSEIGKPIQCTGIVTSEIFKFLPKKHKSIINKIKKSRIISPNGEKLEITFKEPDIILNRDEFDQYYYTKAKKLGVKFLLKNRFVSKTKSSIKIKNLKTKKTRKISYDYLIGADGPNSSVGKAANMLEKRSFHIGVQAIIKRRNENIVEFYPYKDGYGWAVPENKMTLRIGVAVEKNAKKRFEKLRKIYSGKIVSKQAGLIPIYNPKQKLKKENVFLIGDAAGLVKATTGGGIVSGLRSAELVANKILGKGKTFDPKLKVNLLSHLKIRKVMDTYSKETWNKLIKEFNRPRIKKILAKTNREQSLLLLIKLTLANPRLLFFGLKPKHLKGWI